MSTSELTQAELFDIFSNARRRQTVQFLNRQHGSCDLAPLVEQVAAWENDTHVDDVTRTQRRRVYISLYQTHLPMLEDHGIIDWDPEAHRIELEADFELFEPYLGQTTNGDRPWHTFYASLSVIGAVSLLTAWLSIGPLTLATTPFIALVLCVFVFALAVTHHVSRRPNLQVPFRSA